MSHIEGAERVQILEVPHVQQRSSWDCGLACVLMALRYMDKESSDLSKVCKDLGMGDSIWTVDLAHILQKYNIHHKMYTLTLGVDTGYSKQRFYKSSFSKDENRVNQLFEDADNLNISVCKGSVSCTEIIDHLAEGNIAIVLTDWSHLTCTKCKQKCHFPFGVFGRCLKSYQGHFIVACGYSWEEELIYYRNPSYSNELCMCSFQAFDKARKTYGTDEDILFIYTNQPSSQAPSL